MENKDLMIYALLGDHFEKIDFKAHRLLEGDEQEKLLEVLRKKELHPKAEDYLKLYLDTVRELIK